MNKVSPFLNKINKYAHVILFYYFLLFFYSSYAQNRLYLGINIPSLIFGTLDFQSEYQIRSGLAIQMGLGLRAQGREVGEKLSFPALQGYIEPKNRAISFSVGTRIFNPPNYRYEREYPFILVHFVGSYYNETIEIEDQINNGFKTREVSGLKWGVALGVGYHVWLSKRIYLDIGLQLAYSSARSNRSGEETVLAYYIPQLGFTTFGLNRIGFEGGHIRPVLTLKYYLIQNKRDRIRDME